MQSRKYLTARALLASLSDRLKQRAIAEGLDIQVMRRQVAFDRLLVRLFSKEPSPWVLKGGYAMELRLSNSRTTKDIDLELREWATISGDKNTQNNFILRELRRLASIEVGDFFIFQIKDPVMNLCGPRYGGARFPVVAYADNRTFASFHLDVGVGDPLIEPLEIVIGKDWLGFAGFHTKGVPSLSVEQHFAEKLHAYTQPRGVGQINSRAKDLIDMILLIRAKKTDMSKLKQAVQTVFACRKSHQLPRSLNRPPRQWSEQFSTMSKNCQLEVTMDKAFVELVSFIGKCFLQTNATS